MTWLGNFLEFDKEAPPFWQNWLIAVPGCVLLTVMLIFVGGWSWLERELNRMRGDN